jgi:4-amino-4-deoxy-L-arabinose transferase-like glycosyltransferase
MPSGEHVMLRAPRPNLVAESDLTPPVERPRSSSGFRRALFVIVLLSLALRVGYVLTVTRHDHHLYDAVFYELEARTLADGKGFVNPFPGPNGGQPEAGHPPLTVLVLAPAAVLGGDVRLWMQFTTAGLGAVIVLLVGLLGRDLAGERAGLLAAALAAVYANLWMNDGLVMSETLAALTTVGAVLLAYRLLRRPTIGTALGLGAACGLAALARAELVLLVPLLAAPAAWIARRRDTGAQLRGIGAVVGATVLVVGPWVGFNLARFEKPTLLSTGDGGALVGANCPRTYYGNEVGFWNIYCVPLHRPPGDLSVASDRDRTKAVDYARAHAGRLPVVVLARVGRLLGVYAPGQLVNYAVGEGRPRWASYLGLVTFLLFLPLAVAGGRRLRRRRQPIWPLLAPVVLVVVAAALVYGTPRFRAPAEPTVVVLAAVGVAGLLARRWPAWAPEPERSVAGPTTE